MFTKGTVPASVWRAVIAVISFMIPLATMASPEWQQLTVGGVIFAVLHYAEANLA